MSDDLFFDERVNDSGGVKGNVKVPAAFFEVSPRWAKAISEAKTVRELAGFNGNDSPNDFGGNIQDYNSCIVGEAWHEQFQSKFTSDWHDDEKKCKECLSFSNRFGHILRGQHDVHGNRKQQLVQNIKDFTDHWRSEHNPLVELDTPEEIVPIRA